MSTEHPAHTGPDEQFEWAGHSGPLHVRLYKGATAGTARAKLAENGIEATVIRQR